MKVVVLYIVLMGGDFREHEVSYATLQECVEAAVQMTGVINFVCVDRGYATLTEETDYVPPEQS